MMNTLKSLSTIVISALIVFAFIHSYNNQAGKLIHAAQTFSSVVPPSVSSSEESLPGPPTVTASFMNTVLTDVHSPAQGIGQVMYDDGVKSGIDPVFALAFFKQESSFGLRGVATQTHSIGNIRCTSGYSCDPTGGYRSYASWADGVSDWYLLLKNVYLSSGLTTVEKIIPVYAPKNDSNDEQAYIQNVMSAVRSWRQGKV